MQLCLGVGNSHLLAGVYSQDQLIVSFRYPTSQQVLTSDQLGVFILHVLRENNIEPQAISDIALCSVVPALDYSVISACKKYFDQDPFVLKPGVKTGFENKNEKSSRSGC